MIRSLAMTVVALGLWGCGGTQVGNALTVTLTGSDDDFQASAFSIASTQTAVTEGMLSFRAVGIRPSDDCESASPTVDNWLFRRENKIFNYLTSNGVSFSLSGAADQTVCALRFVLGPALSGDHQGKSVYFAGTDSEGNAFTIQSNQFHVLALRFPTAQTLSSVSELRTLMSRRTALDTLDLSALGNPATLTPGNPIAFKAFLGRLRRALIGHLLDSRNAPTPPPAEATALGDEDQDQLLPGEE